MIVVCFPLATETLAKTVGGGKRRARGEKGKEEEKATRVRGRERKNASRNILRPLSRIIYIYINFYIFLSSKYSYFSHLYEYQMYSHRTEIIIMILIDSVRYWPNKRKENKIHVIF